MEQFAHMLETLKAIPEGDGNLLDSCCILASTDTSDGRGHSIDDYPILVAGRAGGALKYPGIHYRSTSGENTSKVLLSLVRAMGLQLNEFGGGGGRVSDSLSAIET